MTFIPQYDPLIQREYADAVHDQIMSGWIGPGKTVEKFEEKICEITGSKYCISTTSGTTAIYIALLATCRRDSYIKFPDYTFIAGANAARLDRHIVDLIDVREETLCMNPDILKNDLEFSLDCWNGGVIFVNHNGYVGKDRLRIRKICDEHNIPMIEDSSQALGICDENGIHSGKIGDVGIFSFSVPKLISTGQGGCIITDNDDIAINCKKFRDHGDNWRKTKTHNYIGGNFKFNDILASYGLVQLNRIDELLEKRKQFFDWYRKHIQIIDFGLPSTWMVLYKTKKAKEIIEKLAKNEIQATQYYKPIHTNKLYFQDDDQFPISIKLTEEIVYLPSSLNLDEEDVNKICKIIKGVENE